MRKPLLLAAVTAVLLTGCGGQGGTPSDPDPEPAPPAEVALPDALLDTAMPVFAGEAFAWPETAVYRQIECRHTGSRDSEATYTLCYFDAHDNEVMRIPADAEGIPGTPFVSVYAYNADGTVQSLTQSVIHGELRTEYAYENGLCVEERRFLDGEWNSTLTHKRNTHGDPRFLNK